MGKEAPVPQQAAAPAAPPKLISAFDDTHDSADVTRVAPSPSVPKLPNLGLDDDSGSGDSSYGTPSASLVSFIDELDPTRDSKHDSLRVLAAGRTDVGKRRKRNEDRYLIVSEEDEKRHLFAVVDGMGGHDGGGIAGRLAAEVLAGRFGSSIEGSRSDKRPRDANALVWAIEHANRVIWETAQESPTLTGMGTTVVAALYDSNKRCVYIAYVGDSRAYRLRRGRCELLTVDHTIAREGPLAGYLRRALGVRPQVKVDIVVGSAEAGDTYLLCSDGLPKMKTDQEIAALLAGSDDPQVTSNALVDEANQAGGLDNIAVVVIRLDRRDRKENGGRKSAAGEAQT